MAIIGVAGMGTFVLGFFLFWAVGARVAGGDGLRLPGSSRGGPVTAAAPALPVQSYPVALDVSPRAFRDVSYVPVKGIYLSSYVAGVPRLLNKQLALADRTEINAMVIDVKDATGYVSYARILPTRYWLGPSLRRLTHDGPNWVLESAGPRVSAGGWSKRCSLVTRCRLTGRQVQSGPDLA